MTSTKRKNGKSSRFPTTSVSFFYTLISTKPSMNSRKQIKIAKHKAPTRKSNNFNNKKESCLLCGLINCEAFIFFPFAFKICCFWRSQTSDAPSTKRQDVSTFWSYKNNNYKYNIQFRRWKANDLNLLVRPFNLSTL